MLIVTMPAQMIDYALRALTAFHACAVYAAGGEIAAGDVKMELKAGRGSSMDQDGVAGADILVTRGSSLVSAEWRAGLPLAKPWNASGAGDRQWRREGGG